MNTQASAPDVYRAAGQTLHNNNGRWFVEDDHTHQVRHVGDGDFQTSYTDCVSWLSWYREGQP